MIFQMKAIRELRNGIKTICPIIEHQLNQSIILELQRVSTLVVEQSGQVLVTP